MDRRRRAWVGVDLTQIGGIDASIALQGLV